MYFRVGPIHDYFMLVYIHSLKSLSKASLHFTTVSDFAVVNLMLNMLASIASKPDLLYALSSDF